MGCNCNKRKQRVLKREEMLADRAARIASANPTPPAPAPTWNPANGPSPTSSAESPSQSSG